MPSARRGEVWFVDLGFALKARPCLLLEDSPREDEKQLITVVAHTTSLRGERWEHPCPKPFLKAGAFHLQDVHSIPVVKLERRLGELTAAEMDRLCKNLHEKLRL